MIRYLAQFQESLQELPIDVIYKVIQVLHRARLENRFILIMGNGGSAATATHFVADLSKNTFKKGFPSFRAISLSDNIAMFSAYANDEGYAEVYRRQVTTLASPGDVIIAISASGNSPNVVNAVKQAKEMGVTTIGFTGFDGGQLGSLVDIHLNVSSNIIEQVEDIHLLLQHLICKTLREDSQVLTDLPQSFQIADSSPLEEALPAWLVNDPVGYRLLENLLQELKDPPDFPDMLQTTLKLSLEGIGAASGSIIVLDDKAQIVDGAVAYLGQFQTPDAQRLEDFLKRGLAGWVVHNRQATLIENTCNDPRWLIHTSDQQKETPRSAISVPLLTQDYVAGVLTLGNFQPGQFNKGHLILLTAFSLVVSFSHNILSRSTNQGTQTANLEPLRNLSSLFFSDSPQNR